MTNDGTWTYTYDADGNMVKKSKGASAETWTFGYDIRNHLVWTEDRATDGGSLITRLDYKYDVLENRIEKDVTANSVTTVTRFAYDGHNVWADLNGSNALQVRRLFLDNVDSVFARIASGTASWYVADRLGSIQDIENYAGTMVLGAYTWDAFGNLTSESNSANGDRYGFTGREREKESGQQYNHHRYYDPATGRWTSQDPIGFGAAHMNLYRYVKNDVTTFVDPFGDQQSLPTIKFTRLVEDIGCLSYTDPPWAFAKSTLTTAYYTNLGIERRLRIYGVPTEGGVCNTPPGAGKQRFSGSVILSLQDCSAGDYVITFEHSVTLTQSAYLVTQHYTPKFDIIAYNETTPARKEPMYEYRCLDKETFERNRVRDEVRIRVSPGKTNVPFLEGRVNIAYKSVFAPEPTKEFQEVYYSLIVLEVKKVLDNGTTETIMKYKPIVELTPVPPRFVHD
jgi:RHS repeat-associated protein